MKEFLRWIWQLPQNIAGWFLSRFAKEYMVYYVDSPKEEQVKVYFTNNCFGCGVSLGDYIILDYKNYYPYRFYSSVRNTVKHEHGHQIQSRILGPLYLILVGISSAIFNNLWDRIAHRKWSAAKRTKWYYSRYPEKWADKLGGAAREFN